MEHLEIIKNDMFDIAKRLKYIDKKYLLVRNKIKKRFELWYDGCVPKFQLVFKTKSINKSMLDYVNETRVQNIDKIIKDMDKNNERIKLREIENAKKEGIDRIREVVNYANK